MIMRKRDNQTILVCFILTLLIASLLGCQNSGTTNKEKAEASHGDGEFDTFFLFVQWEKRIRFAKKINRYGKKGENS